MLFVVVVEKLLLLNFVQYFGHNKLGLQIIYERISVDLKKVDLLLRNLLLQLYFLLFEGRLNRWLIKLRNFLIEMVQ